MIKEKLALVPEKPGCYLHKDKNGTIIYVGKAKNLKRRVSSYFNKIHTGKTKALVDNIVDFEYIVTNSEMESFILEINLIKKYDPKYNILLKDDKTYPYIMLTNEKYPTLKIIRSKKRKKTKNKLFGPFPNVTSARTTVDIINRIYPLRKCNNMKKDLCLYYHIGECLGYCKYEIDEERVSAIVKEITSILNGDYKKLTKKLEEEMYKESEALNYEKANLIKHEIDAIKETISKQIIVSNISYDFDVFGTYSKDNFKVIETLLVRQGVVIGRVHKIFNENMLDEDFTTRYVIDFYEKYELPKEIVINNDFDSSLIANYFNINVIIPEKGNIKKILEMANNNANITLNNKLEELKKDKNVKEKITEELKNLLGLEKLDRIELFDNSHLFGTYYVGGMVVYKDMEPARKEYRKYKISVDVKDDLSAMKEVLYRRYYKVLLEDLEKPDLIIVDGGELQINAAKEIINSLGLSIKIIGLKKDDKHRTSVIVDDSLNEIPLPKDNNLFLYLTRMQDEVHRFAISYHRDIKTKGLISSILDNVSGIGEQRKKELLKKYKSITKIKEASIEELSKIIPEKIAIDLKKYLEEIN